MTQSDVKVECPLPKSLREISVMNVVEMIVELKAHSQNRVQFWIDTLPDFEKSLTEVAREL